MLLSFHYFYVGVFSYLIGRKGKLFVATNSLINNFSYRPPLHYGGLKFLWFVLKESLKKIWGINRIEFAKVFDPQSKKVVISNLRSKDKMLSQDYLEELNKEKYGTVIYNDAVYYSGNFFQKIALTFLFFLHFTNIIFLAIFIKNRKSFIYTSFELVEIISLLFYIKKRGVDHVTTFNSFEKSSNFFAYLLQKIRVRITKVCTPNPIKIHYKYVIADEFVFTAPYQQNEYSLMKANWFVEKTLLWPVYEFKQFKESYYDGREENNDSNIIGFYSSGFLKREINGDNVLEDEFLNSEVLLLEKLKAFLTNFPEYDLKIYLHPIEKVDEKTYLESVIFYKRKFEGLETRLKFLDFNTPTWKDFDNVNVSVAVISTVNFERIYCGYKTMYAPLCFNEYFLDATPLESIIIKHVDTFEKKLQHNLKLNRLEFFKENGIDTYSFYSLPQD